MGKPGIPDRWLPYSPMGSIIPGTRFIACKVPLKEALLRSLPKSDRFGPQELLEAFPKVGLLVDLTNTTRYYFKQDFTDKNIRYEKIFCPGKVIPPNSIIKQFYDVVDDFLSVEQDPDAVIVVHCTHGVNRTGYFICRYMIEKLNMTPEEALKHFQMARGHDIERENYVYDLKSGCKGGNESHLRFNQNNSVRNWRETTYSKRGYRRRVYERNGEITAKGYKDDYSRNPDDSCRNRQRRINERRQKNFTNSDVKKLPDEGRKYSDNWRDYGRNQNAPSQSTTPTPHVPPTHWRMSHQECSISNYQTPKLPQHNKFPVISSDGERYPKKENFLGKPPFGFRGSSREQIRRPPCEEFRGQSHEAFHPLPKFCYPETSDEAVPSSRPRASSNRFPKNFCAPAENQTLTSEFRGKFRGSMLSRSRGRGRGYFDRRKPSRGKNSKGPESSRWRGGQGLQSNNFS